MSKTFSVLGDLKQQAKGYYAERILAECEYAAKVSLVNSGKYDELLDRTVCVLSSAFAKNGALTKKDCLAAEKMLSPLAADAKKYGIIFIGHAHIDMNWMWSYSETVAVTLETFRTVLKLMRDYPDFTFAQSQASVYRIVEKHEPEMLSEIKKQIRRGRWEVTASQWVEADKNMSGGEAQARHLLYTKQYLSKLLGIDPASLNLDFEPDTFGHNANIPEILNNAGVKYYYHCRGQETDDLLYRWRSPSGAEVLVNREAFWYNGTVGTDYAPPVCELCERFGIRDVLRVYGVGDHGGGPTRRDIERIMEYSTWPIYPRFRFGTFREYYAQLESIRDTLPVIQREMNTIFTGCYTTQSRIKLANKLGESRLTDADIYAAAAASLCPKGFRSVPLAGAWENILFNQFHDILPGSGIIDTREYAMGIFHQSLAVSNTESARAMRAIASEIDTSSLPAEDGDLSSSVSEGAGVGFSAEAYGLPKTERGRGKNRIFHLYNPSMCDYAGPTRITLWDWPGDFNRISVRDSEGNPAAHQLLGRQNNHYWGHEYRDLVVDVRVPALGYTTCTLTELEPENASAFPTPWERIEQPFSYVLENENLRAVLDTESLSIRSLIDKKTGAELLGPEGAGFVRILEDSHGMSAWRIGRHKEVQSLHRNVRVTASSAGALRSSVSFTVGFGKGSNLSCTVSLDRGATALCFDVKCDWLETGDDKTVPQLAFRSQTGYRVREGKYSVAMGIVSRPETDLDVPSLGLAAAAGENGRALVITAQGKYGYRLFDGRLSLTLLHGSTDPDRFPELGEHTMHFTLGAAESDNASLSLLLHRFEHPLSYIPGGVHGGSLPLSARAFTIEGDGIMLSSLKPAEDGRGYIARVYETCGKKTSAALTAACGIRAAFRTDIPENDGQPIPVNGGRAEFEALPYTVNTIRIL